MGILYFAMAAAALHLTKGVDGIATVWPSSGVGVAGLLLAAPGERRWIVLAIAMASFAANFTPQGNSVLAAGFTFANVIEAIIAFKIMNGIEKQDGSLFRIAAVMRFCCAALIAATVSATIASLLIGDGFGHMFISWLMTVSLGIMIVVPLIMNFMRGDGQPRSGMSIRDATRTATVLLLVGVTSAVVFAQSTYPLLFLPLLSVLMATYFIGPTGATCSTLMIAAIGSVAIWQEHGPISLMHASHPAEVLFFQFYLFTLLASALPLAALVNTRDRSFSEVERGKRWLEMSESIAKVGHWRLELLERRLFWSSEVYRIHGLPPERPPSLDNAIEFYHPEDRVLVDNALTRSLDTLQPVDFEARIVRADGAIRYVYSCSEVELRDDGKPVAIFGIFQDVTNRVLAAMELTHARTRAEAMADQAMQLAETDPLTGIANRRKAMIVLDAAVDQAAAHGTPLAVASLDIDRFKQINDRLGHAVGDQVLRRVAQTCAVTLRGSDFVGRVGGEEFVVILPATSTEMAFAVAERVRRSVEQLDWAPLDLQRVTVSIGLTNHVAGMDREGLLAEADRALYQAKNEGRNRLRQVG
ncbi:hypothetical protein ADT71_07395 [Novosphingobium sp. ST904]|nr:hypothetical protein ADT71_07395 [Novosphingobium sp. ST904]